MTALDLAHPAQRALDARCQRLQRHAARLATGFRHCGSIIAALTGERREEILRQASLVRAFGVEVNDLSPAEVKDLYQHLNIEGVTVGVDWVAGTEQGHIAADLVVNCGRIWGRDLTDQNGVTLPLHACEHFYIVTEAIKSLSQMPVLRVPDECAYYKEDAGKMLLGAFEPKAKPWACFTRITSPIARWPLRAAGLNPI